MTVESPLVAADLKCRRETAGLTQEELAARAGITAGTVRRIEKGHVQPTRGTMRLLALALVESLRGSP
jgi:predicted transcriptional regulator